MSTRADRAARIEQTALDHAIVKFAADALDTDADDVIRPDERTAPSITAHLDKPGTSDDLVAAVLALTHFSFVLRATGSTEAADAILASVRAVSERVQQVIAALPADDPLAGVLGPESGAASGVARGGRLAAFRGDAPATFERKPPQADEVKATHARLSLRAPSSTKKKDPRPGS